MTGEESASALVTRGSSISSGRRPRARLTRSRTSLAASSTLRSRLNSTVMREDSSWESERMTRMPSMEATSRSSGSVTLASTTSAEAPR
jgi:hypothetical protein